MSSTRHAAPGSPLRQWRWASAPEFERGVMANLAAKRCGVLDDASDRELVWFLQLLSRREGGLRAVVDELFLLYPPDQFRDPTEEVEVIGFVLSDVTFSKPQISEEESFKVQLADFLLRMCLDPGSRWDEAPSYYGHLRECLEDYKRRWVDQVKSRAVVTSLGEKMNDALDYSLQGPSMILVQGEARTGKTFAARAWCEGHPGQARFVEVPPGNDDSSFFRAIGRSLGISVNLNIKANLLRERVEEVLLSGDLLLCLDEAHRLWPQVNHRYGYPARVIWVMSMANQGVPIALISTPQFLETQKALEDRSGWNSRQFQGRIGLYVPLPRQLEEADLVKVARACLPKSGDEELGHIAVYAMASCRQLAAVDAIVKRARFLATRAGREDVAVLDIRAAMRDTIIPSDSSLTKALEKPTGKRRGRVVELPEPVQPQTGDADSNPLQRVCNGTALATPSRRIQPAFSEPIAVESRRSDSTLEVTIETAD